MNTTLTTAADNAALDVLPRSQRRTDREATNIALARAARERIQPKPLDAERLYDLALSALRRGVDSGNWTSHAEFCAEVGIDKAYLAKCWPRSTKETNQRSTKGPQVEMGVGVFSRICLALGLLDNCEVSDEQLTMSVSLLDYLRVNNGGIMRVVILLQQLG